jgi:TonB-linked SusC/RagA family outer membrane protein
MKKKFIWVVYTHKLLPLKKILLIMKLILLFTCVMTLHVSASVFSQQITLNQDIKGQTIRNVLKLIEKESNVRFFYNEEYKQLNEVVMHDVNNGPLSEMLDKVLATANLTFKVIENNFVVVYPKGILQETKVTGTITDAVNGAPLPGVSIHVEGTSIGVITDAFGKYSIGGIKPDDVLAISFIGFNTEKIKVGNRTQIDVSLVQDIKSLDEVVVIAFGTQKKSSLVSSIETINPKELKIPSSNLTTALAGRLAGLISYQRSGEPGADNASFFIRGVTTFGYKTDPLILIDGIETTATELARMQPDDVETFSIMKDATASALYGSRGANGVILITTKSGEEGPVKVSFRFENSLSSNTKNIQLADPITYMKLQNEAVLTRNPLGTLPYSQTKIDNTIAGTNPYVYPANDWMKQLIKNSTNNQRMNFSASGGGKIAKYYIAGTFNQDNGILKVEKRNNFNSNIDLKSYQLRSNININMTKTTEAIVRLSGSFDDYRGPIDGGSGTYKKIMRSNPVLFPAYYPSSLMPKVNHILFGNYDDGLYINPYAEMVKGYKDYNKSQLDAQFELKQDFSFITKGLSARGMFNTSRYSYFDVSRYYNPYYYEASGYNKLTDSYSLELLNESSATEYLNYNEGSKDINTSVYIEAAAIYNRTFAKKHDVGGLLVYQRQEKIYANQGTLQESLPHRNIGLSGRFTYGYDTRYMAEFNFGYNGSERFYKSHRYGFFPAVGLGWYVSNEKFWEPLKQGISKLKFKGTYGLVGNDAIGDDSERFFYLSDVNMSDSDKGATFGEDFSYSTNGITVDRYDNRDITWEMARKLNVGIEMGLFNDIEIQVDYFTEHRSNILMTRSYIPSTMGLSADVQANSGKAKGEGVDGSVSYKKNFSKDLWLQLTGNFTYAHSEYVAFEEPAYKEKYKSHLGKSLSQTYGLIAERLFVDDYEVANAPVQNYGDYMAGDIKYKDVNGDGKITDLDQVPIGFPTTPEINYGFGFSIGYKGLDFSAFFQGSARSSFWIDAGATAPFVSYTYSGETISNTLTNQLLKAYADNHWSEDNRNLYALWPRLSNTVIENNTQTSTWFMRNGAFLRLKSVEFGYSLSKNVINKLHIKSARFYASGTNLLLISGFNLWDIEMGGNGLGYPIQKVLNLGIQVGF